MTFESFPYVRPDMAQVSQNFEEQLKQFQSAQSPDAQSVSLGRLNEVREEFWSMYNLCYVRHTSNTADPFYEKENEYFDEQLPSFEALNNRFFRALLSSPFRDSLEQKFGRQLFTLAELSLKTFKPSILEDLQQENALSTEYTKLKAQALVELDGERYNLSSIRPLELSDNRETRRRAAEAKWRFFDEHSDAIESIFDKMVKVRHRIAQELGYRNFVEVGYARMRRSDYTPEMVANFRRQVREILVPLASELYERQRRRLGVDTLEYYDADYKFPSGNPKPIGSPAEIVANAARMYRDLSPDTDRFFQHMQRVGLMDLVNRDGKAPGGYCTYMSKFQAPFIFSNFNGTSGDIDVLTHEAGHAFQVWSSSGFPFDEYHWPTSDAAEIHSMSMEFFTWPWMNLFFGTDTEKYRYMHLVGAIQFLPYGVAVDEFQHIIYENPNMTPAERNAAWRQLERTYLPHCRYDGNEFLEKGGFWHKQGHIFVSPFYYIDYTLAQICAFQFWTKDRADHETAWRDYMQLCKAGGSQSFLGLVKLANLRSPFEDGCVEGVVSEIRSYLDGVDDSKF
ncbi:MAG: M3 family oligoendopeptidase [Saprospiraceae bacterium]|nr:M3 family oligoendopeptidase [Saprospiraceae bacterium]MCB0543972.1 M3 family oligoendopeptidase [Saprospiraceae bacterium]MCB0573659.1 M3 family oligoendopeptidase [Saprospiraceae bacterium]MCB9356743.1 M3 family oligoendopeptidase [Lewinellaceae bacterium]